MKHLLKIALSGAAACTLCAGLGLSALAYDTGDAVRKADMLHTLTLFQGSNIGYELEKPLDRMEALIMLIRLSGSELDALYPDAPFTHPFTDAPDWEDADNYIGYAYENGLTAGVTETTFAPEVRADLRTYVTFALRALGYDALDAWNNWETLAEKAGILPESVDRDNFLRGDAVVIAHAALDAKMADENVTLKQKLLSDGVFSEFALAAATASDKAITPDSPLMDIMGALYAAAAPDSVSRLMTQEINADNITFFLGADAETIGFVEGIACEPMISASAHSVCLARVAQNSDMDAAKTAIREKVNPRKWICVGVSPQNVRVENIGNLILLVMDNSSPDAFVNRFRAMDDTLLTPDENGMLFADGRYVQADEAVNISSVERFTDKLNLLKETYFWENKTYYATIPEKSYFLRDKTTHFLNHDTIAALLDRELNDTWNGVDIADVLTLDDYYATDRHWRQECLFPVVNALGEAMGFTVDKTSFTQHTHESFRGAYAKDVPDIAAESFLWLVSPVTDAATVKDFQHPSAAAVYDESKLDTKEPYDIFLSGATPLTTVTNPNAAEKRRLILFRDSYGSSLAPLLLPAYSEITLVDLRYMASNLLGDYVDFTDAEVLFLFSDKVVNNSVMLK